tara:strand:- start:2011 stop:3186 length:1176 start_codon:yes stop_codon:yes gene_type:complete
MPSTAAYDDLMDKVKGLTEKIKTEGDDNKDQIARIKDEMIIAMREEKKKTARLDSFLGIVGEDATTEKLKAMVDAYNMVTAHGGFDVVSKAMNSMPRQQASLRRTQMSNLNARYREMLFFHELIAYGVYMVEWTDLLVSGTNRVLPVVYSFVLVLPGVDHPKKNKSSKPGLLHVRFAVNGYDGEPYDAYILPDHYQMVQVHGPNCANLCEMVFSDYNTKLLAESDGLVAGGVMTKDDYIDGIKKESEHMIASHVDNSLGQLFLRKNADDAKRRRSKRVDYTNGGFGGGSDCKNKRQRGGGSSTTSVEVKVEEEDEDDEVEVEEEDDVEDEDEDEENIPVMKLMGTAVTTGVMERVDSMVGEEQPESATTFPADAAKCVLSAKSNGKSKAYA